MKARLLAFWEKVGPRDLFIFAGLVLVTVGAGMVYLPAAPLGAGVIIFSIGIFGVPTWR